MSLHTVTVGLYVYSVYFWCFDFNNPKVLTGLIFEDYNRILLCDWVIELCSVRLIDGVSSHNAFAFYHFYQARN